VATDLEYLLQGKYYAVFGGEIEVIPKDSLSLVVKGIDSKKLSNVIEAEKDSTKSLNSISSIKILKEMYWSTLQSFSLQVFTKLRRVRRSPAFSILLAF